MFWNFGFAVFNVVMVAVDVLSGHYCMAVGNGATGIACAAIAGMLMAQRLTEAV